MNDQNSDPIQPITESIRIPAGVLERTWAGPALLAATFIVVLGVLLSVIQYRTFTDQRLSLVRDTQNARRSVVARLDSNQDFFGLLAELQAEGSLDVAGFQERVTPYVVDHPELISVTWIDPDFVIRWVAPFEPNRRLVGLKPSLPEPKRALQVAHDTRRPVYTRPFMTLQGHPAVELYVPVFRDDQFLGTFVGAYALERVLRYAVPPSISDRYHVSMVDDDGALIAETVRRADTDSRLIESTPLAPPIEGLALRLTRYATGWGWEFWALTLVTVGLAVGMGWSMWALGRDIQIRKQTLAALAARETQYRGVFEATLDGLIINDMEGFVVEANPAACEMHGYSYEEFIGLHPVVFIHPDYHNLFAEYVETIRAGNRFQARAVDVRKDGSEFYVEVVGAPFSYKGKPHCLGVVRDVTERVMFEQLLEQRVADRTRDLAALFDVTAVASESLKLETILHRSLERVLEVMETDAGIIHLLDETRTNLCMATCRGLPMETIAQIDTLPPDDSLAGLVVEWEEPVVVSGATDDPKAQFLRTLVPSAYSYVGVPMRARGRVVGVLGVLGETSREFTADDVALLGAIADQVGGAVENAHLYQAEMTRRREAVRRREVAEGLRDILAILNSDRPIDEMLDTIVSQASRLLGADAAAIVRRQPEEGILRIQAACGLDREYVEQVGFPIVRRPYDESGQVPQPVLIPDITAIPLDSEDPRLPPKEWIESNFELLARVIRRFRAYLAVPLIVKDDVYGGIVLYYHDPQEFSDETVEIATAFADQVALALENARLRIDAEQLAVMNERSRLARELHDSVTQSLYSLTLFSEAGRRQVASGERERLSDYLTRIGESAQAALREMRLLVYELRPLALQHEGLVGALQHRLDAVERRAGIEARLVVAEVLPELPAPVEETLYRVSQEALNNALKHSAATEVTVQVGLETTHVVLEVTDNGFGFDPDTMYDSGGIGLASMQERVAALGGTFAVRSRRNEGTHVRVEIPVEITVREADILETQP